jgi:hypothetical protein
MFAVCNLLSFHRIFMLWHQNSTKMTKRTHRRHFQLFMKSFQSVLSSWTTNNTQTLDCLLLVSRISWFLPALQVWFLQLSVENAHTHQDDVAVQAHVSQNYVDLEALEVHQHPRETRGRPKRVLLSRRPRMKRNTRSTPSENCSALWAPPWSAPQTRSVGIWSNLATATGKWAIWVNFHQIDLWKKACSSI